MDSAENTQQSNKDNPQRESKRPRLEEGSSTPTEAAVDEVVTDITGETNNKVSMYDADYAHVEDPIEMSDTASADEMELEDAPEVVVTDLGTFDLEAYASNFSGMALIDRMVFIASRAPTLRVEALTIALKTVKEKTTSTKLYREVWRKLYPDYNWDTHTSETPGAPSPDYEWLNQTQATAQVELADRERDIKTGKSKNLKASVWVGYTDLANFHYQKGEWSEASKNYMRARDYISSVANEVKVCEGAVRVYTQLNDWREVATFVMRAERVKGFDTMVKLESRMKCYLGVSHLMRQEYKQAAQLFAGVQAEYISDWTEMLTPRTLAIYGGLTLMATMDRPVFRRIMESIKFKAVMTHAPEMQAIAKAFYSSKYSDCLQKLTGLKTDLVLDMYLSKHVEPLLTMIREKAMIQYFHPFQCVSLTKMAAACDTEVTELQTTLAALIVDDRINARIDSHNKIMLSKQVNNRKATYEKASQLLVQHLRRTHAGILCSRMLAEDLHVGLSPADRPHRRHRGGPRSNRDARGHPRGSKNSSRGTEEGSSRATRAPVDIQPDGDSDSDPERMYLTSTIHAADATRSVRKGNGDINAAFDAGLATGNAHYKNPEWFAIWDDDLKLDKFLAL